MSWDAQPPQEPPAPAQPVGYDQYGRPVTSQPVPPQPAQGFPQQGGPQWHMPQPDMAQWNATQQWDAAQAHPEATLAAPWDQAQHTATAPFFGAEPMATTPPPSKSRTGLYVGLGAGAVLIAGVVAAVVAMSGGSPSAPKAQGAGSTASAGPGVSTPNNVTDTAPTRTATSGTQGTRNLRVPTTAGPLRLLVNADTTQRISDLKKNLVSNTAYPDPRVGFYRVGSSGSYSVWMLAQSTANLADFQTSLGVIGPAGVMKQITDSASMKNVTVENPGPSGGALDCGKLTVNGTDVRSCVWVDRSTFGWVYFLPNVNPGKVVQYTLDLRAAAEH